MDKDKAAQLLDRATTKVLPVGAAAACACTLYLVVTDKTASAGVAAGFTVVLILLHNLPRLTSLKGWGVEAKLKEDVAKAQDVLDEIRTTTLVLAKNAYSWLALAGYRHGPNWAEAAEIASDLDSILAKYPEAAIKLADSKRR